MYNDSTFDDLFTGSLVSGEWVYPTAAQNLVVKFSDFYLSAMDGDFSTDGATITSEIGESDDITVGNAPAQVFTATMLNPGDTMDALTWGNGQVYIGAETASGNADTYQSYPVHILVGTTHYSIDANGVPRRGTSNLGTLGGSPVAVISNSGGTDVLFITTTAIGRRQGSTYSLVSSPNPVQAFMAAKCRAMAHSTGILLDANGLPSVYNSVEAGTKQTFSYVPMGVFDFSGVDAYGITFGVEAFDLMTKFDADATEWWNALDFSGGRTLSALASTVVQQVGFSAPTISADAVNTGVTWTVNPITSYSVTFRDIVKWLAEAMACNVRMTRTGGVEFYTFNSTSVATITPNTIVGNSRIKGKATIPAVTRVVCYNVLGAAYTSGSAGSDYYVVANPFIDPSASMIPLNALSNKLAAIPAYFPTTLVNAYADPRLDAGDFISIQTTDGQSAYTVPLMHQTLTWNGICTTTMSATGSQVRAIPEGMNNTDLSSMVDSNPSAVVNKIEAHGISADWITSGKLTVLDNSNRTLFEADKDNEAVQIGGFTVNFDSLTNSANYRDTEISSDGLISIQNNYTNTKIQSDGEEIQLKTIPSGDSASLSPSRFTVLGASTNSTIGTGLVKVTDTGTGEYSRMTPYRVEAVDGVNTAIVKSDSFSITDGTNTLTQAPTGVTFDDGTASSKMTVIKRTLDSADTTTVSLANGVYLAIVTHTNNSTAAQQGLYVIQAYSTSCILTIAAASNSTLSVSGLTLTWTTTNTYRALRLIKLT